MVHMVQMFDIVDVLQMLHMVELLQVVWTEMLHILQMLQMLHMAEVLQMLHILDASWWWKVRFAAEPCRRELLGRPVARYSRLCFTVDFDRFLYLFPRCS